MFNPQKMTPETFITDIANAVISGVKATLKEQPVKNYDVVRQTPTGPINQSVSLAQMLAELTDQLKVSNEIAKYHIALMQQHGQATEALRIELEKSRKLAIKSMKDDDE